MKVLILGGTGYIGSALFTGLKADQIDTVDLEWFGNFTNPKNDKTDYRFLSRECLQSYDAVILVAAHSSVPLCENDKLGAFRNNVVNFGTLVEKLADAKNRVKFIYAGSSCVYVDSGDAWATEEDKLTPVDMLSYTKTAIDQYVPLIESVEYYGLRFGSVNGWAPNFRKDLMINAMTCNALSGGTVTVSNGHRHRPILAMSDLVRAVQAVLDCKRNERGIYNVASFNSRIEDIAQGVAEDTETAILKGENTKTYDFCIDTQKFQDVFSFKFEGTIENIVSSIRKNWDCHIKYTKREGLIY